MILRGLYARAWRRGIIVRSSGEVRPIGSVQGSMGGRSRPELGRNERTVRI